MTLEVELLLNPCGILLDPYADLMQPYLENSIKVKPKNKVPTMVWPSKPDRGHLKQQVRKSLENSNEPFDKLQHSKKRYINVRKFQLKQKILLE